MLQRSRNKMLEWRKSIGISKKWRIIEMTECSRRRDMRKWRTIEMMRLKIQKLKE